MPALHSLVLLVRAEAAAFVLSWVVAYVAGHRVRFGHWTLSLAWTAAVQAAAWALVSGLPVPPPAPAVWLPVAVLAVATISLREDWNALGHGCMAATLALCGSFFAYLLAVNAHSHLGPLSTVFATVLLALQAAALVLLCAGSYEILDVMCRIRWRRVAEAVPVEGFQPRVSLHVPAYNEPPELVIETLDALSRLDYPDYEVLVIDNNTRDEALWRPVEAHCARLGFTFIHLENWPGYKSGALNHGLTRTDPRATLVGVVDADYVVGPDYLRCCTGFFRDPAVAFVQTPQDYRDVSPDDVYAQACYDAYLYFFKVSMAARNEHNGIIFAGTMGLIRRSVLEGLGGWDEWCITEDAEISLRILDRGDQGIYVDRSFGRGIMPLNFEGLKKQRFRWAFGGMQILRRHWSALMPWARWTGGHRLRFAQQVDYLLGGLQWLNDPLTLAFTMLLLIGSGAILFAHELLLQPLAPAVMMVPFLFIFVGVSRFLWALRVRLGCGWRRAMAAFTILMGLTWVVTLACVLGLVKREGVFLRTPKQRTPADPWHAWRIVQHESTIACLCAAAAFGVMFAGPGPGLHASVVAGLLGWQFVIYASAPLSSLWGHRSELRALHPESLRSSRTTGERGSSMITARAAAWSVAGVALLGALALVLAVRFAPERELAYRAMPERDLPLPVGTRRIPAERQVRAILYFEKDAALRSDVDAAMRIWADDGIVRDTRYTPDDLTDDSVWVGRDAVRARYAAELARHRYLSLRHSDASVVIEGDRAVVVNDLHATIQTPTGIQQVYLARGDRWTFERRKGRWQLVSLEVNRAPR